MPLEQTITIINNSGKIISTGKHLVNIFKDAKAAYQEKKASLKSEKIGVRRAQTFDVGGVLYEEDEPCDQHDRRELRHLDDRRRSHDDLDRRSYASSRSHRSRRSHRSKTGGHKAARPPLTESNLRTLSEVSSTTPTVVPKTYRSPYAETAPRDMALSRPTLNHAAHYHTTPAPPTTLTTRESTPVTSPRQSVAVARPRSDPSLRQRSKSVDLHLAYGNIPPDLESRTDLDPAYKEAQKENEAKTLMGRIETLLTEAQCVHHTATSIISHLQGNPEAAAAVALTLAELSALLAKMSPAFLGIVKSGSPAIFALLASPQFLIGTSIAVGVTVVMFGGWKIIKRIKEAKAKENDKMAFEMQDVGAGQAPPVGGQGFMRGASMGSAGGFDEALVLDDELSTIETWRRGIVPFGEDESVDIELISPEAMRSRLGGDDRTVRGDARSVKTSRTGKSHKTHRSGRSHRSRDDYEVPERKSSKAFTGKEKDGEGRSGRAEAGSHRSSRSNKTDKTEVKAIEDGSRQDGTPLDLVLRPKEKKNNMLKQLFKKKKDKDDKERSEVSVVA